MCARDMLVVSVLFYNLRDGEMRNFDRLSLTLDQFIFTAFRCNLYSFRLTFNSWLLNSYQVNITNRPCRVAYRNNP